MNRVQSFGLFALLGVAVLVQACSSDETPSAPQPRLVISSSPTRIAAGESATLTVTATEASGEAGSGTVELSTPAGVISPPTVTLADGTATATFTCEAASAGCAGNVRVVGKWNDTSGGMVVMVNAPGNPVVDGGMDVEPEPDAGTPIAAGPPVSIGWVSSKCGGQDCRLLGIKGSGINEQAQISFLIEDANNVPVRGVDVTFALIDDPKDTKLQAFTAKSNSLGIVTARVVSGPVIGAFSVTASVASPALSARSSSIGVRGAKPSNAGFNLQCEKVNLPVYTTAQERRLITLPCTVGVTDRYNNPVGTGTSVLFKTEAGNITNEVATVAYDPEGTNATEGTAPVVFNTGPGGIFPPVDVEPLAAATQWPFNQTAEPQRTPSGADPTLLVYNPRDQLVTVLAYVQGEEHFWDDNQNGIYDAAQGAVPAERFIDQGEPFVDANDNNIWDKGEVFIDSDQNGVWTAPDGMWSGDTTIWTERRLLFTGYVSGAASKVSPNANGTPPTFSFGTCAGDDGIEKGGSRVFYATLVDRWMNLPTSGSKIQAAHTAGKGAVSVRGSDTLLDGYGFDFERRLVDASSGRACAATSVACRWKTLFYDMTLPAFVVDVEGAPPDDTDPCEDDRVSVGMTVESVYSDVTVTGAIK